MFTATASRPAAESSLFSNAANKHPILVIIKDKLTDLCGNQLLQNDLKNTFCAESSLFSSAAKSAQLPV